MKGKRILITGGAGDLGKQLIPLLISEGALVTSLDPLKHEIPGASCITMSILDRGALLDYVLNADLVIHIAAWHGFHEFTGSKNNYDFWDLNMTGTFNLLQACKDSGVSKFIFISSTSVDEWPEIYGLTKVLGEDLCRAYAKKSQMSILALRPRAFIPWWNKSVYASYLEWARWFAKGAVHIDDVVQSVLLGCQLLFNTNGEFFESIEIDGKHDFLEEELAQWQRDGWASILNAKFEKFKDALIQLDFHPSGPPTYKNLSKAQKILKYSPHFGFSEMIEEMISLQHR